MFIIKNELCLEYSYKDVYNVTTISKTTSLVFRLKIDNLLSIVF